MQKENMEKRMTNNVCSVLASLLILFGVAGLKIYIQIRHLKQIRQKMKGRNFSLFSFDRKIKSERITNKRDLPRNN